MTTVGAWLFQINQPDSEGQSTCRFDAPARVGGGAFSLSGETRLAAIKMREAYKNGVLYAIARKASSLQTFRLITS